MNAHFMIIVKLSQSRVRRPHAKLFRPPVFRQQNQTSRKTIPFLSKAITIHLRQICLTRRTILVVIVIIITF